MARPLRIEFAGAVYHVTSRGNERRKIFFVKRDFERFKEYLTIAQERFGCFLHGYVLMSNHYHLILETPTGNLSKVMHYLNGSYTTYLNAKRKRRGHLFQGRYKSIVVDRDAYLLELSRYLHLNPVRAGMVERPEDYAYSSYHAFVGRRVEPFLSPQTVLAMIATNPDDARRRYREFVESAVGEERRNPFEEVYGGMILGDEIFIKTVLGRLESVVFERTEVSHRKVLDVTNDAETILERVCALCNCQRADLESGGQSKARKVAIYSLRRWTTLSNREIGAVLGGLGSYAVSKSFHRSLMSLEKDGEFKRVIEGAVRGMSNVQG